MITVKTGPGVLEVQGHAGWGPRGQDIVCAGASALVYALAGYLEETGDLLGCRLEPGYALVQGRGEAFRVAEKGLRMLAEAYPGAVEVRGDGPAGGARRAVISACGG